MEINNTILIVEDDRTISHFIARALEANGYRVISTETGIDAKSMIFRYEPMLILLDLGLPDEDGILVLEWIKEMKPMIPVIIISARDQEDDKIKGLDCGADDYITKPFGTGELMARIRTALRHAQISENVLAKPKEEQIYRLKDLELNVDQHRVILNGEVIHFTMHEFEILEHLFKHQGKVLTYTTLLKEIWGDYLVSDNRILRVNMANIRRKLKENPVEPKYIQTELGIGYRLFDENE
ncbi:MAG: response regulator transcription factor [Dorea sp.]|nr:response regulator transcription factor [Dorea sp.]